MIFDSGSHPGTVSVLITEVELTVYLNGSLPLVLLLLPQSNLRIHLLHLPVFRSEHLGQVHSGFLSALALHFQYLNNKDYRT